MNYQVRDFRGCVRADIECNPIALIGGRNGMGKTSIAQGIGAVLTGQTVPLAGLQRGTSGMLVRTGAAMASVTVKGESGTARIDWPPAGLTTNGEPPQASPYAAGLASVALMLPIERVRVMSEYLKSEPTRDDLRVALEQTPGLGTEPVIEAVWTLIQNKGWDGAHSIRQARGAELKGRWRQITGVNYGSRVAASWRPDLAEETLSETELVDLVRQAAEQRDRGLAAAAVSQAARDRLTEEASILDVATTDHDRALGEAARLEGELAALRETRAALPSGEQPTSMPCPHCGAFVVLRRVSLVETRLEAAGQPISQPDLTQYRRAIAEADGQIEHRNGELFAAQRTLTAAAAAVSAARTARQRLSEMPPVMREDSPGGEAGRAALAQAEKRLAAYRQKAEADDVQAKVVGNETVLELLAPDGLRGKKLGQVLEMFNGQLADLAASAGWQPVSIDMAMQLTYGGRPYPLLSSSEQYRVRVVLQLAMARLDASQCVVIDAADILDAPTRSGLFQMLQVEEIPAVVLLTLSRREQLPNLAAHGLGTSYWIEAGTAEPLAAAPREAAA